MPLKREIEPFKQLDSGAGCFLISMTVLISMVAAAALLAMFLWPDGDKVESAKALLVERT